MPACGRPRTRARRSSTRCSARRSTAPPARAWSCASSAASTSSPADAKTRNPAEVGYATGVPMGGDLTPAPAGKAPSFLVAALKDPIGANLDRIQIVKGWQDAGGALQEKVYDVAWGDADDPQAGCERQAAAGRQHGRRRERHLDQHHRRSRADHRMDRSGLRPGAARLLLRARDRDPDAALDRLRCQALRRADAEGGADGRRSSAPTPRRSGTRRRAEARRRAERDCCASRCCTFCCSAACCSPSSAAAARSRRGRPADRGERQPTSTALPRRSARTWHRPPAAERAGGADPGLHPRGGAVPRGARNSASTRTTPSSVAACGRRWSSCSRTRFRRRRRPSCAPISSPTVRSSAPQPLISFRQVFVSTQPWDCDGGRRTADPRAPRSPTRPGRRTRGTVAAGRRLQPDAARSDRCPVRRRLRQRAGACRRLGIGSGRCDPPTACTWSWSRQSSRPRRRRSSRCAPAVEREWFAERRAAAQAAQYQALLAGYRVDCAGWPAATQ